MAASVIRPSSKRPFRKSTCWPVAAKMRGSASRLATDLKTSPKKLLQHYLDRWQIEVNHRDEKALLAVGHPQVWSPLSVPRQPAFTVACYSMVLLACLRHSGPGRTHHFAPLP